MDHDNHIGEQGVDRRRMIKAGAAGVGVLAAAIATTSSPVSAGGGGNSVDLRVIADPSQLDLIPSPTFAGQGPFYIPGTQNQLGIFHCWGFFYNGGPWVSSRRSTTSPDAARSRCKASKTVVRAPSPAEPATSATFAER